MDIEHNVWESPHEMFETWINLMAGSKGNPPVDLDLTELPIGSEVEVDTPPNLK